MVEKYKHLDGWKSDKAFHQQLSLNKRQFQEGYPIHWPEFIRLIKHSGVKSVLDVGCGCGFYHNLCRSEFPEISYKGIDYAPQAIELAIENFPGGNFEIKNILDLDSEYVSAFDLVHLGALLDVLPNGDEVLEFLLSLQPQKILLGRVRFTDGPSFFREYIAYSDVNTYEYYHNRENFLSVISKNNYSLLEDGGSLLLERLEEINKK